MQNDCIYISRRDFIKSASFGFLGLSIGTDKLWSVVTDSKNETSRSSVVIGKSDKVMDSQNRVDQEIIDRMLEEMMKTFTGKNDVKSAWKEFFSVKDVVGIKTNAMMAATHKEILLSIVKSLKFIGIPDKKIIIFERGRGGYGESGVYKQEEKFGFSDNNISKVITDHATALINVRNKGTLAFGHCRVYQELVRFGE